MDMLAMLNREAKRDRFQRLTMELHGLVRGPVDGDFADRVEDEVLPYDPGATAPVYTNFIEGGTSAMSRRWPTPPPRR